MQIRFYTTVGCHLCEDAMAMLNHLLEYDKDLKNVQVKKIDIAKDENLLKIYGTRIPVLAVGANLATEDKELGWPFEISQLADWITRNNS